MPAWTTAAGWLSAVTGQITIGDCYVHGVLRSEGDGATFADITAGLDHEAVFRIRASHHDPDLVLAGMVGDGIERSLDRGQSWERHTWYPSSATAPGAFAQSPSNPDRIYIQGSPTCSGSTQAPAASTGCIFLERRGGSHS